MHYSTILLAGGEGSRFGGSTQEYKAFIKLKGVPLFLRVLKQIPSSCRDITIATSRTHTQRFLELIDEYQFQPKPKLMFDETPFQGPMSGILTGMQGTLHDCCLVVPCDVPLLKSEVLQELIAHLRKTKNTAAIVPRWPNGYIEPLTASYRKSLFLEPCRRQFEQGERRISKVLEALSRVRYVKIEHFQKIDPELLSFININTEEDYLKLETLYRKILVSK